MEAPTVEFKKHIIEPLTKDASKDVCKVNNAMPSTFTQTLKNVICWEAAGAKMLKPKTINNQAKLGTSSNVKHQYGLSLKNQSHANGQL